MEDNGVPISITVDGANKHDMKMAPETLENIVIDRLEPTSRHPQNMCLDNAYDFPKVHELLEEYDYMGHIKSRGEEYNAKKRIPGYTARRWVVERTHSWINRFRRLLIRWKKKVENYIAVLHFACAWITYRVGGIFGQDLSRCRQNITPLQTVCSPT